MSVTREDLLQAKRTLSLRFLRRASDGAPPPAWVPARRVAAARMHAAVNVHAVGVGQKEVDGKPVKQRCVRFYVIQKLPESLLDPASLLPAEIDGIPTDVIESPPAFLLPATRAGARRPVDRARQEPDDCTEHRRRRRRPLVAGISTAHHDITAGTLSCFCRSVRPGDPAEQVYVLSNNHVFADVNRGKPGDALFQPGPVDGGSTADKIAELRRFVPIKLGGAEGNRVDGAIGALVAGVEHENAVCTIGPLGCAGRAHEGDRVRKHGRTTGLTAGTVTDEAYDARVGMDHADASVFALFENQLRIQRAPEVPAFGLGGDSGSLVVAEDQGTAVGLYFAGPGDGSYGVANQFEDVLRELEVELL